MHSRRARLLLALLLLIPSAWRSWAAHPSPPRACVPEGRGAGDATWVGCATDVGPRRELSGRERVAFGLPVPLNRASASDLAAVPGLTARLAAAVVVVGGVLVGFARKRRSSQG